jgi:uncharacterized protein (DUF433 family)
MRRQKITVADVWGIEDPRDVPAYTIVDAAHYLNIPHNTIRSWVFGRDYKLADGTQRRYHPVIKLPNEKSQLLSFFNLVEAHVLRALRARHSIDLPKIRRALKFVQDKYHWQRPLIQQQFKTDGVSLFIDHLGQLVDASESGQVVIDDVMDHLNRIEWEGSFAVRLFPFTRTSTVDAPKTVFIDPRYSFGRPILKDCYVATAAIAERYKAGESIEELADDYGCTKLEIEEGIRCELRLAIAA